MAVRGYRKVLNAHALNMVIRPVDIPRPKLAVFPQEHLQPFEQPFRFVPAHRQEVKHEDYKADIDKHYEQRPDLPKPQKPPKTYWLGYPVY